MPNLIVKKDELLFMGKSYKYAYGKNGFTENKIEGDNKTPVGIFPLREVFYKNEKPATNLPTKKIKYDMGWCDDPKHENYNKLVGLPFSASHEKLLRDDNLYDIVVVIGYNDSPVIASKGSAIFMHIAKPSYEGTEGCIALKKDDLLEILKSIDEDTKIEIRP